jgi:hypothetical protein
MLTILGRPRRVCSGLSRRELLQAGGAGLLGLSLPRLEAAAAAAPPAREPRAKSVIFLFLFGGPSQLETFDLKPDAPSGIRGPFKPVASRTPGLRVCEHLPRLAQASDKFCVVRTLNHPHNDHNASHYIQTGHPWPRVAANGQDVNATDRDWPSVASVVEYLDQRSGGAAARPVPSAFYLPNRLGHMQGYDRTGQYAGWLGRAYNPLATDIRKRHPGDNPFYRPCTDADLDYRVKGLAPDPAVTLDRLDGRRGLLEQFEAKRRELDAGRRVAAHGRLRERALRLVTSEALRTALDIRRETDRVRDRYGRDLFGQSTLLARRLVEAGARFVTVASDVPDGYGWDSHVHSDDVQRHLLPNLDRALSALLADLEDRGLLRETLVVALGEMGRTPRGSARWGRGHWSYNFPAVLAGGGIRGGVVYGRSDKDAAYPVEHPVSPEDLAATLFHALGIDPDLRIHDAQGRPVSLVEGGRPLLNLFG